MKQALPTWPAPFNRKSTALAVGRVRAFTMLAEVKTSRFIFRTHSESDKTIYDLRDSIRNDKGIADRNHRGQDLQTEESTPASKEETVAPSCIH